MLTDIPRQLFYCFRKFSSYLYNQNLPRDHQNTQCNSQSLLSFLSSLSRWPLQPPLEVEQASFKPVQRPTSVNHAMLVSLVASQQLAFVLLPSLTWKVVFLPAPLRQQAQRPLPEHPPQSMVMQRRTKESI